jgi:hypothetical protein
MDVSSTQFEEHIVKESVSCDGGQLPVGGQVASKNVDRAAKRNESQERFAKKMELLKMQREKENHEFRRKKAEKEKRKLAKRAAKEGRRGVEIQHQQKANKVAAFLKEKFGLPTVLKTHSSVAGGIPHHTPTSLNTGPAWNKPLLPQKSPLLLQGASGAHTAKKSKGKAASFLSQDLLGAAGIACGRKSGTGERQRTTSTDIVQGESSRSVASCSQEHRRWALASEVPDFEVNSVASPTGEF